MKTVIYFRNYWYDFEDYKNFQHFISFIEVLLKMYNTWKKFIEIPITIFSALYLKIGKKKLKVLFKKIKIMTQIKDYLTNI